MRNDDDRLAQVIARVDGRIPLDPSAADRILERALIRLDDEASSTIEPTEVPTEAPDQRSKRWVAAAAGLLIVLGTGIIALLDTRLPNDGAAPADTSRSTLAPIDGPGLPDAGNWLGLTEFSSQIYRNDSGTVASLSDRVIVQRVGESTATSDGSTLIELRRSLRRGDETSEAEPFSLTVMADGSVVAPVDYIVPNEFGGPCTGGAITIAPLAAATTTPATCDGERVTVSVRIQPGVARPLPLLAEPIDARPVVYRFTVDDQPGTQFEATLWFAAQGLVRITLELDEETLDLDLDLSSLIQMEETP